MKQKLLVLLACILLLMSMPVTANADMGPKPSVQIDFTGISGETYYATLLSKEESTGPYSAWAGDSGYAASSPDCTDYAIWKKFADYQDSDNFYFLQEWWDCSEANQLLWNYYPPSTFKVLLYFPETDSFYASPIYERYAFDSYYTMDLSSLPTSPLHAETNYDYTWELISLAARIFLTIAIEMGVALLFGYREKKLLQLLIIVNAITQIILNVLLNAASYYWGAWAFTAVYVLLELLVLIIEAIVYAILIPRRSSVPKRRSIAVLYALAANLLSFAAGLWLAHQIPGIF